ncbi:MetQ/NlpA family ABC transporter substrate-binding protein [Candidatus Liberibacter sp.]|uniref:MetQ/NlpA family ABC transporter substrate-binding protein n=1 Tax=Candidatus Liberibacter sp. TaxID=34022 RepID=UPI0021752C2B|nr:MetQ/NlpA family ABC transporter substrate-binding protein [Candidatus Liberibacter sp.]
MIWSTSTLIILLLTTVVVYITVNRQTNNIADLQKITYIKVGINPGDSAIIMTKVKEIAARKGLDIELIEFSDFITPNRALDQGDLDANAFQHKPYLDNQIAANNYKISSIATTIVTPIRLYSYKIKDPADLPEQALVSIPNDPTNLARALLLLEKSGIIKLKSKSEIKGDTSDIIENPKKIRFIELDAAQIPRSLADVHAAVINTTYAISANIDSDSAIYSEEEKNNPYANLIVIQSKDIGKPWVKTLVESYQNEEVKQYIKSVFLKREVLPAW